MLFPSSLLTICDLVFVFLFCFYVLFPKFSVSTWFSFIIWLHLLLSDFLYIYILYNLQWLLLLKTPSRRSKLCYYDKNLRFSLTLFATRYLLSTIYYFLHLLFGLWVFRFYLKFILILLLLPNNVKSGIWTHGLLRVKQMW